MPSVTALMSGRPTFLFQVLYLSADQRNQEEEEPLLQEECLLLVLIGLCEAIKVHKCLGTLLTKLLNVVISVYLVKIFIFPCFM